MTIRVITLWPHESECVVCGKHLVEPQYGIAMYEGAPVPDNWAGEWGGFDVCMDCYRKDRESNGDLEALDCLEVKP